MSWLSNLFRSLEKKQKYENKYPAVDLTYRRFELDGTFKVDLRNFIHPEDHTIPKVRGRTDCDKALNGLKWVIKNIKYIGDSVGMDYWAYSYQTLFLGKGDCEDGAILLYNILLRSGIPYWKMRLSAGLVKLRGKKIGHAYLTFYCEEKEKWVLLDWCYWPNKLKIKDRPNYKEEKKYLKVWFSWDQKYCYTKGLNESAKEMLA